MLTAKIGFRFRDKIPFVINSLRGTFSPAYIYEGLRPIEGNPNRFTHLSFAFYLQTLTFPISSAVLLASLRHSRMSK